MIPKVIIPYLWYLDISSVDLERDKKRIILNVLNYGSKEATDWLFSYYNIGDIKMILRRFGALGELSPKSLNYWCLILNIKKEEMTFSSF
jgi:hypothetical protein